MVSRAMPQAMHGLMRKHLAANDAARRVADADRALFTPAGDQWQRYIRIGAKHGWREDAPRRKLLRLRRLRRHPPGVADPTVVPNR
jgi:CelD/BcsL family acetyltransferase involved in cellulose biosynthesis